MTDIQGTHISGVAGDDMTAFYAEVNHLPTY